MRYRHGGSIFEKCRRKLNICRWRLLLPTYLVFISQNFTLCTLLVSASGTTISQTSDTDIKAVMQITSGFLLHNFVFTSALIIAFIYTFAQDNRGKRAHFIVVQIPVEYLPWAMLTFALVMGGLSAALSEATGIFVAHLYDFLTRIYPTFQGGRNWIQTPNAVKRAFGAGMRSVSQKAYGTGFKPGQRPQPQSTSWGWSSALGGSWGGRGAGRRLGGD